MLLECGSNPPGSRRRDSRRHPGARPDRRCRTRDAQRSSRRRTCETLDSSATSDRATRTGPRDPGRRTGAVPRVRERSRPPRRSAARSRGCRRGCPSARGRPAGDLAVAFRDAAVLEGRIAPGDGRVWKRLNARIASTCARPALRCEDECIIVGSWPLAFVKPRPADGKQLADATSSSDWRSSAARRHRAPRSRRGRSARAGRRAVPDDGVRARRPIPSPRHARRSGRRVAT